MPLYEYRCSNCGNLFEAIRSIIDADKLIACNLCCSCQVERVLSKIANLNRHDSSQGQNSSCSNCSSHACSSCKR